MSFFSYITIVAKEKMGGKKWEFDEKKIHSFCQEGGKIQATIVVKICIRSKKERILSSVIY